MSDTHSPKRKTTGSAIPIQIKEIEKKEIIPKADEQDVTIPKSIPATPIEGKAELTTNSSEVTVEREVNIYRYTVDVNIVLKADPGRRGKVIQLNGRGRETNEYRRENMKALMRDILLDHNLLIEQDAVVYDGNRCIFTNRDLLYGAMEIPFHTKACELSSSARALIHTERADYVQLTIRKCTESANCFTNSEAIALVKEGGADGALRQFVELLTTQSFVDDNKCLFISGPKFCPKTSSGLIKIYDRRDELAKDTSVDAKGSLQEQLSEDYCAITRSPDVSLIDVAMALNQWTNMPQKMSTDQIEMLSIFIEGRQLERLNRPHRLFGSHCLVDRAIRMCVDEYSFSDPNITKKDRVASVKKFEGKLRYPDLPAVEVRSATQVEYFPLELLKLSGHQSLPLQILRGDNTHSQAAPVAPNDKLADICEGAERREITETETTDRTSILRKFGVSVNSNPEHAVTLQQPAPGNIYVDGQPADNTINDSRRTHSKFSKPAIIDVLLFACNKYAIDNLKKFSTVFVRNARAKGIVIKKVLVHENPAELNKERNGEEGVFEMIANMNVPMPMIVYIDPKTKSAHGTLKLLEWKFEVITQHITAETAEKAICDSSIMTNIVAKSNYKCSGYNYKVAPGVFSRSGLASNVLIIGVKVIDDCSGYWFSKRTVEQALHNPTVIGWCSNCVANPLQFIGDFHFQKFGRKNIDYSVIVDLLKRTLEQFKEHREQLPTTIYILRDGINVGQAGESSKMATEELFAYRDAVHQLDPSHQTEFVLIVSTKDPLHRFFLKDQNGQLCYPVSVTDLDHDIDSRHFIEFYCQSRHPLQENVKYNSYQIVYTDKEDMTQDLFQALVLALCFEHQSNWGPISIPEPIHKATDYAYKGNNLLKEYRSSGEPMICMGGSSSAQNPKDIDWEKMTQLLSYRRTKMAGPGSSE